MKIKKDAPKNKETLQNKPNNFKTTKPLNKIKNTPNK